MNPEIEAHFELMRQNLHLSLAVAAVVTLGLAAISKTCLVRALLVGIVTLAGLVVFLNGWPYVRVFFFQDAARFASRTGVVLFVLLAAGLLGIGSRRLWGFMTG